LHSQSVTTTTTIPLSVDVSATGTGDPSLPRTGSSTTPLLLTGLALVVVGLGLVFGGTYVTRNPRYRRIAAQRD
jgi:LPXTG-motif cell wall-anchored protein